MDCSLPGSSIHGISQARVLEWGAIVFSYKWYGIGQNNSKKNLGKNNWYRATYPLNIKNKIYILKTFKTSSCREMVRPAAAAKSLQSCPTLCDPVDGSPPGSPIPGILQARTLEWVAMSSSNA